MTPVHVTGVGPRRYHSVCGNDSRTPYLWGHQCNLQFVSSLPVDSWRSLALSPSAHALTLPPVRRRLVLRIRPMARRGPTPHKAHRPSGTSRPFAESLSELTSC